MACETSQLHIPFPTALSHIEQSGNHAKQLSPQMLQQLSSLPYAPLSESAIMNLLDDSALGLDYHKALLGSSMNQSSIRFPTPDIYHYDSSSSNSSVLSDDSHIIIPRSRRVRGPNSPTASVSHSSSLTPSSIKSRNNPRIRTQADSIKGGHRTPELSDTSDADTARPLKGLKDTSNNAEGVKLSSLKAHPRHFSSEMRASSLPHLDPHVRVQSDNLNVTRSIRKKSGEPIKPSLKRPKLPSLSMPPVGNGVVQSEPTTPTLSKAVHFDAKLEHVKLFLSKQKPLAVSRDHDAATDTSGTESDFPSFVRGSSDDCLDRQIELRIRNMPSVPPEGADVVLQKLTLSQSDKTIMGIVRVRNIAYEKWVAARFTLDLWQTTSEVTARYTESVDGGSFDIFTFSIRLHDMWARIDEKTMFIALRYTVAGRQFWDNNSGANYMIKFFQKPPARKPSATTALASVYTDPLRGSPSLRLASPDTLLSARYHIDSAPKKHGGDTLLTLPTPASRTPKYPTELSTIRSKHTSDHVEKIPLHSRAASIGSPRELEKQVQARMRSGSVELKSSLRTPHLLAGSERDHRHEYFDRPMSGMPPKTHPFGLPEEPIKEMPSLFERFTAQTITRVGSEGSAASTTSDLGTPLIRSEPGTPNFHTKPSPNDSYSQFLNRFCFFTGSNSLIDHSSGPIARSHSASDVESIFYSHSQAHRFSPALRDHAFNGQRSSSLNDIAVSHTPHGNVMLESTA